MTLDELRATKRDAILAIAAKHGASGIRVFGSFARGEARNDSDLDLLIEAGRPELPFFPGGFLADLEDYVAEECALHKLIRDQGLKEAVPL